LNLICKEIGLGLQVSESLMKYIYELGKEHYPNEFGGVLVGYYSEDQKICIISETILPRSYTSKKYSFERGHEGLVEKLKTFYDERPSLIYVGEWHTHPDNPPIPSSTDLIALNEIIKYPEVYITNPILLIISITPSDCKPVFYVPHQNKIYSYEENA
jgi:[CysO sulfur-carrier protein]-S-L-cysteine hydrolase